MATQIVNVSNEEAISEVALHCGDTFFKDFIKGIYSQAVYRANRSIAKEFSILTRRWRYTNTDGEAAFFIEPENFNGEIRVVVIRDGKTTGILYTSNSEAKVIDNTHYHHYYHIQYESDKYVFYYTLPEDKDTVEITYTSSIAGAEDFEQEDGEGEPTLIPVIPDKYFEEIIRRSVRYMAKLGVAQYEGDKGKKYQRILQVHTKRNDEKQEDLQPKKDWISIKPFQYP